jgi:ABC-type glucose/galactose transport system permease subunit
MTAAVSSAPLSFARRYRARNFLVALIIILVLGLLGVFAPNFFKINNLINILVQAATLAVMAVGMSVVMIGGGIDLSLPFSAAVSAVLGAMYMRATGGVVLGSLIMLASATAIGLLNGVAVGYLGMIPFVVTLAMMSITAGSAVWLTNSISISHLPARIHLLLSHAASGFADPGDRGNFCLRNRSIPHESVGLRPSALRCRQQSAGRHNRAHLHQPRAPHELCRGWDFGGHRRDHVDRSTGLRVG